MATSTAAIGVCVGAVVAAGVYVLWGPESLFRRKGHCVGLENLGNTCFVSAILQALASVPGLPTWLAAVKGGKLKAALHNILCSLSEDRTGVMSPAPVLQALAWHCWTLDCQQQDAHELYHVFLTTLSEELESCPSLLDGASYLLQEPIDQRSVAYSRTGTIATLKGPQPCPLQGLLTSELICYHCQHSYPVKCELFDSLSLTLPLHLKECTLQSCLLDYVKSEVVTDVECSHCSQQVGHRVQRTFMKRLQLARPPPCLCLHLKRTVWLPSGSIYKNPVSVSFPSHLDTSVLSRTPQPRGQQYELVAVIEHMGGPFSGHYITYRKLSCRDGSAQWVYTSDRTVYKSSLQEALGASAYMMFYCRVPDV